MARLPSEKTQLSNVRRQLKAVQSDLRQWQSTATTYRTRATRAEQEVDEWKARFDKLLEFRKALGTAPGEGSAHE